MSIDYYTCTHMHHRSSEDYSTKSASSNTCSILYALTLSVTNTVKPVKNGHSQKDYKMVFKTNYHLTQVKSIREHSAIRLTFIKLLLVIKNLVLSFLRCRFTQVSLYSLSYLCESTRRGYSNQCNKLCLDAEKARKKLNYIQVIHLYVAKGQ